jgi:hypothetical protein
MQNRTDFYLDRLRCLIGGKIISMARSGPPQNEFDDEYFGLVIALPDGSTKTLILLSDDEGNGPGSFDIETQG